MQVDPNAEYEEGICSVKTLTNNGRRQNHADAFLTQCKNRKNLIIRTGCISIKILIDNKNKTAYGVKYVNLNDNKTYTVYAVQEIMICLGAFESPKLLMLSGIGQKSQLEKQNITCIKDLAVGKQMYDQISFNGLAWTTTSECGSCNLSDIINNNTKSEFVNKGAGPLSAANGIKGIIYKKINSPVPNVQVLLLNWFWSTDNGRVLRKTVNMNESFYNTMFKDLEGNNQ